jgi:hypothetical protein
MHRGPLEWNYVCTKFHEYLPRGSKIITGGHTDRQTGDLISLLSFLEITIKSTMIHLTYSFIYLTKQSVAQST